MHFIFSKIGSFLCSFCKMEDDTLLHLLYDFIKKVFVETTEVLYYQQNKSLGLRLQHREPFWFSVNSLLITY